MVLSLLSGGQRANSSSLLGLFTPTSGGGTATGSVLGGTIVQPPEPPGPTTDPVQIANNTDNGLSEVTTVTGGLSQFIGTEGDDTLTGQNDIEAQIFAGANGADVMFGTNGNDTMYGGDGVADSVDGNDSIMGNAGNDLIYGNAGNDTLLGGNDQIFFGLGNDTLFGGRGSDYIEGGGGNDSIAGGGGLAHPEDEADTIFGGQGDDFIVGNGGDDFISGGSPSSQDANVQTDGSDTIYGGLGNDTINGGGAAGDLLFGQFGNDVVSGGGVVSTGAQTDTIYGGSGNDTLYGESENEAGGADPTFDPDAEIDFTALEIFPDSLFGEEGIDVIYGGLGSDTIHGGAGNDILYGNEGRDIFAFTGNDGVDLLMDFQPQYDFIQVKTNINGTGIATAADVIARATYTDDGLVINLGNGQNDLIMFSNYVYEATLEGGVTALTYIPFTEANVLIVA